MTAMNNAADLLVAELIAKAKKAQKQIEHYSQNQIDLIVSAAAWAILEPQRNRELANLAVQILA